MDANNTQVIGEMYSLFRRVDGLKPLQKAFRDYIQKVVESIVKDASKDDEMVPRLLKRKSEADNTISKAFLAPPPASHKQSSASKLPPMRRDPAFVTALNDAFTYGFRARRSKPAEMIARYLHQQLRKGQKGVGDGEYQAGLDAALALYRFSEDKDVFRTFYHRSLAKRLLQGSSASDDFEAAMLKKLKESESSLMSPPSPDFG
jgi:cullin-4